MITLEILTWEGCPSTAEAIELAKRATSELSVELKMQLRAVNDFDLAQMEKFIGSPTFRVGGRDLFDVGQRPYGLSCRVYSRPGGKFGPLPDYEEFKANLQRAIS